MRSNDVLEYFNEIRLKCLLNGARKVSIDDCSQSMSLPCRTPVMHKYSGYSAEEVEPWTWALNHMLHIRKSGGGKYSKQHTVADKYSHE